MDWEKRGVNYWENLDCPDDYLRKSLTDLIEYVEGVSIDGDLFGNWERCELVAEISFFEDVADK